MCLDVKRNAIKRIALKDIVCYKFVYNYVYRDVFGGETYPDEKKLITPYQEVFIEIGKTYKSALRKHKHKYWGEVNYGLHSFKNIEDAKRTATNFRDNKYHIVKCVIPRWSMYYVGKFNELPSFASSKIKYVEIIK
jgi:hypothetical protein